MSLSAPNDLLLSYTRAMMGFLLFNPFPKHIIMVGLGGGSLAKYCYSNLPDTRITVLELDADVIALRDQFMIPPDDERFRVIHTNAVDYLAACPNHQAQVILLDGFNAEGPAPELSTTSFYATCKRVLTTDGILVSNIWGNSTEILPVIIRLNTKFDWQVWCGNACGSYNYISFSVKGASRESSRLTLMKNAAEIDKQYCLFLSQFLDQLHAIEI